MSYLELNNVSFIYPNGSKALKDVSFKIKKKACVAIVGKNGAGKTTTAKLMNGLLKPTLGNVIVDGWNTKDYSTAKISKKVGYVFQNPDDQIFHKSVYEEIVFGPKNINLSQEEIRKNVMYAADLVGIKDLLNKNPYDLSFSTRKFITIASVIAINTDIIILDEPTAGQSLEGLEYLSELIKELVNTNKTVITITHDMEFVVKNFSRTIVMAHGNKIADGSTKDIFRKDDILDEAGLKPSYIGRLVRRLGYDKGILDIPEFIEYIEKLDCPR